jgi:hypothetical protein
MILDVLAPQPSVLWQINELGHGIEALSRSPDTLYLIVSNGVDQASERWHFEAPNLTLRKRSDLPEMITHDIDHATDWLIMDKQLAQDGTAFQIAWDMQSNQSELRFVAPNGVYAHWSFDALVQEQVLMDGTTTLVAVRRSEHTQVFLGAGYSQATLDSPAAVFCGTQGVNARCSRTHLVVWDQHGRVATVLPGRHSIDRRVRISA